MHRSLASSSAQDESHHVRLFADQGSWGLFELQRQPGANLDRSFDQAVLDIGSNSVRLVVYRCEGRAIWTVFNEKILAGLGRGVAQTGRLSAQGVPEALAAIRRFKAVLDGVQPKSVIAVATAAVRDAADGPEFLRRIRDQTQIHVRVLSGVEEAKYAGLGVLCGSPTARGVAGDLGGSSLELIPIADGAAQLGQTFALGPFALNAANQTPEALSQEIDLRLAPAPYRAEAFYAVGGAWRTLAQIWMQKSGYPLHIIQSYMMSAAEVSEMARFIAKLSKSSLEKIPGVAKRRVETLPHAALTLDAVVRRLEAQTVFFSAYGLRDGLIYETFPETLRAYDPLIEGSAAIGARQGLLDGFGAILATWLSPAFAKLEPVFSTPADERLLQAAARLCDIGARLHPDHRADLAFSQVMRAPTPGQNHAERVFLALALHARYGGDAPPEPEVAARLLTPDQALRARAVGLGLRLGCDLSARSPQLLSRATLNFDEDRLILSAQSAWSDILLGEQTAKRAAAVAATLGLRFP